jgi:uncharacterized protein YbbK (DUF523 family)
LNLNRGGEKVIIVSACLCGVNCRYDGASNYSEKIAKLVKEGKAVPVCPEQMGGLTTPRDPVEIKGGTAGEVLDGTARVMSKGGKDATAEFLKGAEETLKIAEMVGAEYAVLKARSPSCGCGQIYDGTFSGRKLPGNGVTAELLLRHGIKVYTEENWHSLEEE